MDEGTAGEEPVGGGPTGDAATGGGSPAGAAPDGPGHRERRRPSWAVLGAMVAALVLLAGALAAVATGLVGGNGPSAGATGTPDPRCGSGAPQLTVHGTGIATGTPDLLTLSLAVSAGGSSAQAALSSDNSSTAAVVAALAQGGVAKADVQTTGLSIQPSYDKTGTLTGYSVSNSVVAKIHDFATAGSVIDAAAGAAGNAVRIDSLSFSIQDPRGVQDQARQDAVHQAVSHAATMAAAAGERLGPVCSLTDDTSLSGSTPSRFAADGSASGAVASPSVPLEAGTQQASAQVTLVYALDSGRRATTTR